MFKIIRIMCGNMLIRKKYIVVLALALALTIAAVFLPLEWFSFNVVNRIVNDVTPLYEQNIDLGARNIFIVHTDHSDITKDACAIESAAKANPSWLINVLLVEFKAKSIFEALMKTYPNIRLHRFFVDHLFQLYSPRFLRRSRDALKFMALRYFGGVVLDSQVIVMKSFDSLKPNWLVRVGDSFTTAAMATRFANNDWSGNLLSVHAQELLKNMKNGKRLGQSGGEALKICLTEYCLTSYKNKSLEKCPESPDFEFYNQTQFVVEYKDVLKFLKTSDTDFGYLVHPNVYLVLMRGKGKHDGELERAYPFLAKRHCPTIFKSFFKNTTEIVTQKSKTKT